MVAFGIVVLLLPVLLLAAFVVGAWREGRSSPWAFGVGRVISNSFVAIGGAPLAFLGASFLFHALPPWLFGTTTTAMTAQSGGYAMRYANVYAGWGLLQLVLWPLGQALLTILALDTLAGRSIDVRRSLVRALRLWPVAVVVAVLAWIGIGIGLLLVVVPGIVLLLNWFVVLPVLVAEDATILGSFGRSTALLTGMRWRLLLLLVLAFIAWSVFNMVVGAVSLALGGGIWTLGAVQALGTTLAGMVAPAGVAAVYHEARTAKEGRTGDDLAAVFA